MAFPQPPYEGACLCGSVQVRVTALPLLTVACHCRDCQKLSASAYTLTTMFPVDAVSCTGALVRGGLRSDGRAHYFCKSCLNIVYSQLGHAPERINLRTSILKQAALFEPFVEVMTDEKMPWAQVPAVHSYAQVPASRDEVQSLMDAYSERGR